MKIDLNCDMGESFGAWEMGADEALMDVVTSINVACGFHAGDATVMRRTVATALRKNVSIGAHPSYLDLQGFGRREMNMSAEEVFDIAVYQIAALKGIVESQGGRLHHVKPHGALYNAAAKDENLANALAEATKVIDDGLIFYGLSGSALISEAEKIGLQTAAEVFADRTYQSDGSLTPRSQNNALIGDTETAVRQVIKIIKEKRVTAVDGSRIYLNADTICIHGDGKHALAFAVAIKNRLIAEEINLKSLRQNRRR
jgi:5-oxoprolinase (ATP-hydrolysing) subunit A